ncbi:MAG TPA: methylated-DNA--[protein]-cysteine S-methyltransferase [Candidatus Sulfopaludibacter sp.]|nr:methylated-DNA--[protein]-cysteine S-methyltransferase [Candidatus Sulfopaludibacter sp.]
MNDYERVAQIIRFLDGCHVEQPELAALAGRAGLSRFHFHRLFTKWAGVTPKDFVQCLTLAHARELLREGESILDAALESGLSGPGRLHDLFVNLEAASPGEWKSGGAGWTIFFGFAESPFGKCLIAESPRGVCHLSFVETGESTLAELQKGWPQAEFKHDDSVAGHLAGKIFAPPSETHSRPVLRAFVRGTLFQVRVWRALLQVPPGGLTSYGHLAAAVGQPAAARAVGAAVAQNPLGYLIPCHRVIRETGVMGSYRWGPVRKRAMVAWESSWRVRRDNLISQPVSGNKIRLHRGVFA